MPKVQFEGRIFVIYTEADADKAVEYLNTCDMVGVDTETRPSFKRGTTHKVALLQIASTDTCFLFRLNRIGMPESLQKFLANNILKIGLSLKDDFMMLRRKIAEGVLYRQHLLFCAEDLLALRSMVHSRVIGLRLRQHRRNTSQYIFVKSVHSH